MTDIANTNDVAMYILVNTDLKMSTGKIASQVGHIAEKIAIQMADNEQEETTEYNILYRKYLKNGHKKVVLGADEKSLQKLKNEPDAMYIIDEGRTEIPADSLTVVGFYPATDNYTRFKKFRLL